MLQVHSSQRMDQVEAGLRAAVARHGGQVLGVAPTGHLLPKDKSGADALTLTVCFSGLFAPLMRGEVRFSAFLPSRVAIWSRGGGVFLETLAPRDCCRLLHCPEMEPAAAALEEMLRAVMEEAAHGRHEAAEHRPTEDMINIRGALPQRIDCRGTKIEELAGTGRHDSQGG